MSGNEQDFDASNLIPSTDPANIWTTFQNNDEQHDIVRSIFSADPEKEHYRQLIRQHKTWLESIPHECPDPYTPYRIGVYIRFFNQTRYDNYLDYHKQYFADSIALCQRWKLVDYYVDEGQMPPNLEHCKGWTRLLEDCFSGKINLIVTQKISNVSLNPWELTFSSRILAALDDPVGIYFINEDMFTLASYYQHDLQDLHFLPSPDWEMLPDCDCDKGWDTANENPNDS